MTFKNNKPFFSIVICTYNRDYTINNALTSLFLQDFDDWDLIIVDDGSIDDTKINIISLINQFNYNLGFSSLNFIEVDDLGNILENNSEITNDNKLKVQKNNNSKNIYYYYQSNQGVTSSRNIGIKFSLKFSDSDYITFLDSDDTYLINHLSSRFEILGDLGVNNSKSIDLLHGGVKVIGNEFVPDKNDVSKLIKIEDCVVGGTFFMKKNIFEQVGFFEEVDYSDDSHFFEKISMNNLKIHKTEIPTYIYNRESIDSLCDNIKIRF